MRRDEAAQLLALAHEEVGRLPASHRQHVLNVWAETVGFEDAQLQLQANPEPAVAAAPALDPQGPKARSADPSTSHRASLDNAPRRESQRGRILELLATQSVGKAWLAEEIAEQTGIPLNSVSTRMSELERGNWVSGTGPKRRTKAGEMATSYVPTPRALDQFRRQVAEALAAA